MPTFYDVKSALRIQNLESGKRQYLDQIYSAVVITFRILPLK
jgi:hypothetical protein